MRHYSLLLLFIHIQKDERMKRNKAKKKKKHLIASRNEKKKKTETIEKSVEINSETLFL